MGLIQTNGSRLINKRKSIDPYADDVVFLLKGIGTNGSTSIIDSSPSPNTVTVFGNTQISTAQSKYNGSSILFDGTGDYLTIPSSVGVFGTGDFTVESWFYLTSPPSQQYLYDARNSNLTSTWAFGFGLGSPGTLDWFTGSSVYVISAGLVSGSFYHAAVSRVSGITYLSLNGIITDSFADTTDYQTGAGANYIGERFLVLGTVASGYTGYIAPFRITEGVGRYTSDFNPEIDTYLR